MTTLQRCLLILLLASVSMPASVMAGAPADAAGVCAQFPEGTPVMRTELLFGLARPGGTVSDAEFQAFIDSEVTPRFPQGLTLLLARGQYRQADGQLIREDSRLLILLHPLDPPGGALIDDIRQRYKARFEQESVLRIDAPTCVSF